jgi:hypothetical protein
MTRSVNQFVPARRYLVSTVRAETTGGEMLNQKSRNDITTEAAVIVVIMFFVLVGAGIGWYARATNTNDMYLRSQAEKGFASARVFDAEFEKLTSSVQSAKGAKR